MGADLDLLGMYYSQSFVTRHALPKGKDGTPEVLSLVNHGFGPDDMDRKLHFKGTSRGGNKGYLEELSEKPERATLRQIEAQLRKT